MAKASKNTKAGAAKKSVGVKPRSKNSKKANNTRKTTVARKGRSSKRTLPAANENPSAEWWKSVFIIGEQRHSDQISNIYQGPTNSINGGHIEWDFGHLERELQQLAAGSPDFSLFLYGGSPEPCDFKASEHCPVHGVFSVPTMNVILVRNGYQPPPFVAIDRHIRDGGRTIQPFSYLDLRWIEPSWALGEALKGRVFCLECTARLTKTALNAMGEAEKYKFEYAQLFTVKPSIDWTTEKNDDTKLSVRWAHFEYQDGDRDLGHEFNKDYDKLADFVPNYCEEHDLDEDEHADKVIAAIKLAFQNARAAKQDMKDKLLESNDIDSLETLHVVKIYPQNSFIAYKGDNLGRYYGKASRVV